MSYLRKFLRNKQQRRLILILLAIFFALGLGIALQGDVRAGILVGLSAIAFVVLVWFPLSYLMRNNP